MNSSDPHYRHICVLFIIFSLFALPCWGAIGVATDPSGDTPVPVQVELWRSVGEPSESGHGTVSGTAEIQARIGSQRVTGTGEWNRIFPDKDVGGTFTLSQPDRYELVVGSDDPFGNATILVDFWCQEGVPSDGRVSWPNARVYLWDPNADPSGCGYFRNWELGSPSSCDWPANDKHVGPGKSPAWLYYFNWGQIRPEPDDDIELLDKPYLKAPDPERSRRDTRHHLPLPHQSAHCGR